MNDSASGGRQIAPETRRAIIAWIVQAALGLVGYGLILFLAASRLDWIWGWVLLAVIAAFLAAHPLLLVPINPELLAEREKGVFDEGVRPWDIWALIPALASAGLYVLRTSLEDKTLREELPGYKEYALQTRHRLLPGVW